MLKCCLILLLDKCLNVKGDYDGNLKDAIVTWLNSQADTWYDEGIHKLALMYVKCLKVKGNCAEK